MKTKTAIYVHIPFCEKKCKYCNFASFVANEETKSKYFNNLLEEIKQNSGYFVSSIFFGGGTPSSVNEKYIIQTLSQIKSQHILSPNAEITIECNPCSVNLKKLLAYKNAGFNRISFGVQSFNDQTLKKLGRLHNSQDAFNAVKLAKKAGFNNISIDLILGTGEQEKNLEKNLTEMKNLGVTHISAYMLILEQETPLFSEVQSKKTKVSSEDEAVNEYENIIKILQGLGYERYEISNFALSGFQCKHNLTYWEGGDYHGFGLAAHSYLKGTRFSNTENITTYLSQNFLKHLKETEEQLTTQQKIEESIMLGLRTAKGVSVQKLKNLGYDILKEKKSEINFLTQKGVIHSNGEYLKIMPKFFGVANQIILRLI